MLEEISAVGPGGSYLAAPSTLELYRKAYYRREVFPNLTVEAWRDRGCPSAMGALRSHTRELLEGASPAEDCEELLAQGEAFVRHVAGVRSPPPRA